MFHLIILALALAVGLAYIDNSLVLALLGVSLIIYAATLKIIRIVGVQFAVRTLFVAFIASLFGLRLPRE
jgi:hypothetical protein